MPASLLFKIVVCGLFCVNVYAFQALPGAPPMPEAVRSQLANITPPAAHGDSPYRNRLALENSPYLRQHADNPVNWYPWGEAAFEQAKQLNLPIFLSIGYSTCHWCHVMARESFADPAIAEYLNRHFIAIKVDREQHPAVDSYYLYATQLLAGHGGWPMSVFLTQHGQAFAAGVYFPPTEFLSLLQTLQASWAQPAQRVLLGLKAENLSATLQTLINTAGAASRLDATVDAHALAAILDTHDPLQGGFGDTLKFPEENLLAFLLEQRDVEAAQQAVAVTLEAIAAGGIHDQIGGGFHRYSVDPQWRVPHFEKMLYTQAMLGRVFLSAWRADGTALYADTVRRTLAYVLTEMRAPSGGFYSATDADSEGEEGKFFTWTPAQLQAVLGDDAEFAAQWFGITEHGDLDGASVPHLAMPVATHFARFAATPEASVRIEKIRQRLLHARQQRVAPQRDDKIISAWNALLISTLAEAGYFLAEARYLDAAKQAAEFLWTTQYSTANGLQRIWLNGVSSTAGALEDYAYLATAWLDLYDITADGVWLQRARTLTDALLVRFDDQAQGGFFLNAAQANSVVPRLKSPSDEVLPAANAVTIKLLQRLSRRLEAPHYRERAEAALAAFSTAITEQPELHSGMLSAAQALRVGRHFPIQYAAHGVLRAEARLQAGATPRVQVTLKLAPGWHINSHQPIQSHLIATDLSVAEDSPWQLRKPVYPDAEVLRLGFSRAPLAVYQGEVTLSAELHAIGPPRPALLTLQLTLQACSDALCLPPETLLCGGLATFGEEL